MLKKTITAILIFLIFSGCSDSKEDLAISALEQELTEYTQSLSKQGEIKSYLQETYPKIYTEDRVKILSLGEGLYSPDVFLNFKGSGVSVSLHSNYIVNESRFVRGDLIVFTKNKEKIKEAIRNYLFGGITDDTDNLINLSEKKSS